MGRRRGLNNSLGASHVVLQIIGAAAVREAVDEQTPGIALRPQDNGLAVAVGRAFERVAQGLAEEALWTSSGPRAPSPFLGDR